MPTVRLTEPDGSDLVARFPKAPLASGSYFPRAVWYESVLNAQQIALDASAGINTYLQLTDDSDLDLLRRLGIHAVASPRPDGSLPDGGVLLPDEVDMWGGPGSARWSGASFWRGESCVPAAAGCGYTILNSFLHSVPKGVARYGQFGKGVTFWQSRAQASPFINNFSDIVSADNYWFTDPNICSRWEGGQMLGVDRDLTSDECRSASNYGRTVKKVRSLVSPAGSKPVWGFVELGAPFAGSGAMTIPASQVRAAVWSEIVAGARGIVYFNHSFGGSCQSQHLLREACGRDVRGAVSAVNAEIDRYVEVLNASTASGYISGSRGDVDTLVKYFNGQFYIFATPLGNSKKNVELALSCGAGGRSVTDMSSGESRTTVDNTLKFTVGGDESVRIFRIDAPRGCVRG